MAGAGVNPAPGAPPITELDLTTEDAGSPAPPPQVGVPYDPGPLRESTRTWIVGSIMAILALNTIGLYILIWYDKIAGSAFMQTVFPSLVGLVGTAPGFYFGGGRDKTGG